ncbi:unnamed protein product [Paramecium octaurelia]|uniref:Squalene--hopene cyclase n=1 Tax=Paramecium octaurelia TaxID=43137 RepID=A0A8S1WVV5_PAROT|nr:unnamed protein product [Paramecium octaurelia]
MVVVTSKVDIERVQTVIRDAREICWNELTDNEWVYPTYLGTLFLSEYYFELKALGIQNSQFQESKFTQILLDSQLPDGSWVQVEDAYIQTGQLDATIFNYWYLKAVGIDIHTDTMKKAQEWIKANGGIEKAQTMTKFKLAMFGQYPWKKLFKIPLILFYKKFNPLYIKDITAQWVYPHMTALAYLQNQRIIFNVAVSISELYKGKAPKIKNHQKKGRPSFFINNLVQEMLKLRQPMGSFGGYTVSTLLSMLALHDYTGRTNKHKSEISDALRVGFDFVEFNYFNFRQAYHGSLDDGRWWDTILISWAMLESGEDKEKVRPIVENMLQKGVQPNGGIEYGYDFGYAPDADDTGLLLQVLSYYGDEYTSAMDKGAEFVYSVQNIDGGFPAFDKDKMGKNPLYKYAFKIAGIADSAEIFDPSSPDVTAHILEGLISSGRSNYDVIAKSLKYFMETQEKFGSWEGRWGINYIYAAGAVLPALKKMKYSLTEQWVGKAVKWLVGKQNADGGFGETTLSYRDSKKYNGVGVSTVTQTSWGLLGLLAVEDHYDVKEAIEKAVEFLLDSFERDGEFKDISVVGTGHRGLLYLQYPSYARSFPIISLGRFVEQQR